jgi:uncharacterized Zn-finger protein
MIPFEIPPISLPTVRRTIKVGKTKSSRESVPLSGDMHSDTSASHPALFLDLGDSF